MSDDRSTLEERLERLEARAEISQLVGTYGEALDRRDVETFMTLWHDGAESIIPGGRGEFHGLGEIRGSQTMIAKAWKSTFHWTMNLTVAFESSKVMNGRSDVFAICEHHDGSISLVGGTYWDTYETRSGDLRLTRRLTRRYFVSPPLHISLSPPR